MNKTELQTEIKKTVEQVQNNGAMAASLTNSVTLEFVINTQIAIGGTPGSLYQNESNEAFVHSGNAMSMNLGSFIPAYSQSIPKTAKKLNEEKQNWVLDPVGIGVGDEREKLFQELKNNPPSIIRGNASEIIHLAILWDLAKKTSNARVQGPDSTNTVEEAEESAVLLARATAGVVVVTGESDLLTDGKQLIYSYGGSKYLSRITGGGDSLTGVIAIFAAVANPLVAALTGIATYNVAGKKAEGQAKGPGTFKPIFLDELFHLDAEAVAQNAFDIKELD